MLLKNAFFGPHTLMFGLTGPTIGLHGPSKRDGHAGTGGGDLSAIVSEKFVHIN